MITSSHSLLTGNPAYSIPAYSRWNHLAEAAAARPPNRSLAWCDLRRISRVLAGQRLICSRCAASATQGAVADAVAESIAWAPENPPRRAGGRRRGNRGEPHSRGQAHRVWVAPTESERTRICWAPDRPGSDCRGWEAEFPAPSPGWVTWSAAVWGPTLPGRSSRPVLHRRRCRGCPKTRQRVVGRTSSSRRGVSCLLSEWSMVMARIVSRCSHSWRCQGGTGRPRTGDGLRWRHGSRADERRRSGRRPVANRRRGRRAEGVARSLHLRPRRDAVRAVGEDAGRVGEVCAGSCVQGPRTR